MDPDYYKCVYALAMKINYIDLQCCAGRLINFKCFRTFLTTKCGISKEEVERNDDQHYDYWNNLKIFYLSGKCSGGRQEALEHCKMTDDFDFVNDSSLNYLNDDSYADSSDSKFIVDNSDKSFSSWLTNLLNTTTTTATTTTTTTTTTTPSTTTEAPKLIKLLFGQLNEYQLTVKVERKSDINKQDYLKVN